MNDPLERLRLPTLPIDPRPEFAQELLRRLEGSEQVPGPLGVSGATFAGDTATVRYFVQDVDAAVEFYCRLLGFEAELTPSPRFAMLYRGDLRLLLSVPGEPHVLPDGSVPEPGGWNRISLRVTDVAGAVDALRRQGARLRTGIVTGVAVSTALVEDPSGNLIELFEPGVGYHERPPVAPDLRPEEESP
jgi:catechol 2,3-dioxygenase-like lactoylglutathione lyase family enzyme